MKYSKTVVLKDGRTCIIRNGTRQDAQGVWDNFVLTHGETEYLTTYPEEVTFTLEQEEAYLKQKEESDRDAALLAEVDGKVVGTAGVDSLNAAEKTRHRAHFGISIAKAWWGLGIGRALTEACIECAREAGYLQLELEVVADNMGMAPIARQSPSTARKWNCPMARGAVWPTAPSLPCMRPIWPWPSSTP